MVLFLSNFENKVDVKGRVSFPSQFRQEISRNNADFQGVALYQSTNKCCVEGSKIERLKQVSEEIEYNDEMSEEQKDYYIHIILGGSVQLPFDTDGRIILPKHLLDFAGITEKAVFVGKNEIFEVWEPQKYIEYTQKAQEQFKVKPFTIRPQRAVKVLGENGRISN
ncbi:MAG: division/cell wall cluster transcriptional repressor MraZ [Rickettsiales bacterium]|nr:MAG: division/cell wall cluster transcriptional repressor MraZ [Rickettsiales bacterium]